MEHGLKDIAFYVQKHITPCTVVITSLLVCDKLLGAPGSVKQFLHHNSNVMEISFCSHPNTNKVIATIFGTWHDSWAVVACAKFCRDMISSNWIKAKWNFHRIWIVMEKSLVKWVPGLRQAARGTRICEMGLLYLYHGGWCPGRSSKNFILASLHNSVFSKDVRIRAPSQYKDRLIYVWWFPC